MAGTPACVGGAPGEGGRLLERWEARDNDPRQVWRWGGRHSVELTWAGPRGVCARLGWSQEVQGSSPHVLHVHIMKKCQKACALHHVHVMSVHCALCACMLLYMCVIQAWYFCIMCVVFVSYTPMHVASMCFMCIVYMICYARESFYMCILFTLHMHIMCVVNRMFIMLFVTCIAVMLCVSVCDKMWMHIIYMCTPYILHMDTMHVIFVHHTHYLGLLYACVSCVHHACTWHHTIITLYIHVTHHTCLLCMLYCVMLILMLVWGLGSWSFHNIHEVEEGIVR